GISVRQTRVLEVIVALLVLPLALSLSAAFFASVKTTDTRHQQLAALPDEDRVWLTEFVAPIIQPAQEKLFLDLTDTYQREIFKKGCGERREKEGVRRPVGPGFQRRYEELRPRLYTEYDGWRSDAGRMVLHYGEPIDLHHVWSCANVSRAPEIWTYPSAD